jgi:uncharacterized protein
VGDGQAAAVAETHISTLFFVGDRVYKRKKPVQFDFLDFSTRALREEACRREVELNRRLAPDVYLGLGEIRDDAERPGEPLVVMRRMPDDRRLASLVRQAQPVDACLRETARVVAAFHARAETSAAIDAAGTVAAVRANWEDNFTTMRPFVGSIVDAETEAGVEAMARRYLDGRGRLFAERVAHGKIRDGHGDLLADDIFCLDDGPRILDCIEFDDRLRHGDVLADVAFLAMDLERVGGAEIGARFLAWYGEFAAENHPASLAHHYIAYRAHVRAKVACLRALQDDPEAPAEADRLLGIAHLHLVEGHVALTVVGGLPGTGKSTLAEHLGDQLACSVLRSDELRKDLAGTGHTTRGHDDFGAGIYDAASTAATYRELLDRARGLLELGESVVLDASWSDGRWRDAARAVARETHSDLHELSCEVAPEEAARRMELRARVAADASDATPEIARRMAAVADPWPEAVTIDTSSRVDSVAAAVAVLKS